MRQSSLCCRLLAPVLALIAVSSIQLAAQTLVDAPQPQATGQTSQTFTPASQPLVIPPVPRARRYAQAIEPGQIAPSYTATEKLIFSFHEVARPITLLPALASAGYEQVRRTDPKYGNDSGAFGEKVGAGMLRSASRRIFADGVFAAAFHQDPHYYRIVHGSILHRSLLSAEQAVVRRGDSGNPEFNFSGVVGRAAAAALTATYYPGPSVTAKVVGLTWATSIATDAGGNLVLEFLPRIIRKFPIMEKLRIE